jgi:hypothetical protein
MHEKEGTIEMSKIEISPYPWTIGCGHSEFHPMGIVSKNETGTELVIASLDNAETDEQTKSNAIVMANAPAMLDFVKLVLNMAHLCPVAGTDSKAVLQVLGEDAEKLLKQIEETSVDA